MKCLAEIINAGVDVNTSNKSDETTLNLAIQNGHPECVKFLIEAGAKMNIKENGGFSPLINAGYHGHAECVRVLISAGADVNKCTKYGYTPLMFAVDRGCVRVLIELGADVNKMNTDGSIAMIMAAYRARSECVKILAQAGADVNMCTKDGRIALPVAVKKNWQCRMCKNSYDANKVDKHTNTALIYAATGGKHIGSVESGHAECARVLVEAGADVNKANKNNYTALGCTAGCGNYKPVILLLRAGAYVNIFDKINRRNALQSHFVESRRKTLNQDICMLLYAVGDQPVKRYDLVRKDPLSYHWLLRT